MLYSIFRVVAVTVTLLQKIEWQEHEKCLSLILLVVDTVLIRPL